MPKSQREITALVEQELQQANAEIIRLGKDGAGHQVVEFRRGDQTGRFHFPSTPRSNGRGNKNVVSRLRRILREMAPIQAPQAVMV